MPNQGVVLTFSGSLAALPEFAVFEETRKICVAVTSQKSASRSLASTVVCQVNSAWASIRSVSAVSFTGNIFAANDSMRHFGSKNRPRALLAESVSRSTTGYELVDVDSSGGVALSVRTSGIGDVQSLHFAAVFGLRESGASASDLDRCDGWLVTVGHLHSRRDVTEFYCRPPHGDWFAAGEGRRSRTSGHLHEKRAG